jgi:hypothetical protein
MKPSPRVGISRIVRAVGVSLAALLVVSAVGLTTAESASAHGGGHGCKYTTLAPTGKGWHCITSTAYATLSNGLRVHYRRGHIYYKGSRRGSFRITSHANQDYGPGGGGNGLIAVWVCDRNTNDNIHPALRLRHRSRNSYKLFQPNNKCRNWTGTELTSLATPLVKDQWRVFHKTNHKVVHGTDYITIR